MVIDAPNPDYVEHEHLFLAADVGYADRLRTATFTATKQLVRPCQICRTPIDLITGQAPSGFGLTGR